MPVSAVFWTWFYVCASNSSQSGFFPVVFCNFSVVSCLFSLKSYLGDVVESWLELSSLL